MEVLYLNTVFIKRFFVAAVALGDGKLSGASISFSQRLSQSQYFLFKAIKTSETNSKQGRGEDFAIKNIRVKS